MARYWVTANSPDGFNGRHRGYPALESGDPTKDYLKGFGWFWPKTGIEIEVTDKEEDPKHQPQGAGAVRTIGQRTYRALQQDSQIFTGSIDGTEATKSAELIEARTRIAELEAKLAEKGDTGKAKGGDTGKAKDPK
jgi:hypothetical protein